MVLADATRSDAMPGSDVSDADAPDVAWDASDDAAADACGGQPVPGFRSRGDGRLVPCYCFDGEPLRPVPTILDEGLRSVVFDCEWPEGTIYHRRYTMHDMARISDWGCEHTGALIVPAGYYEEPYYQQFELDTELDSRIAAEEVCVPRECVFDTPGERARCTEDCSPATGRTYVTVYRVDRSACGP